LAVKTRARVRTLAQWVNHVKTAEAVAHHNVTQQLLRQASVQHSLKNQETHVRRVTHAHQQVALATARCAEVAKTRVATGRLRVVPTASHVMVPLVLRLVLLATAIRVRHVTTVLHAVTSVQIARLAHLMATALLVVILVQIARLVLLVTAILVRLAMTVAHAATLVQTVRLVHSTVTRVQRVTTALLVVILDQIARLVHLMVTAILVHVVTLVQTAQRVRLVPTVMVVVQTA
jgi:hypothetical protein